ncbi:MAG: TetR/AcrR family transcriptional regulator [Desulfuromonas sp.]|nr:TetR/AcrR family transcriptional regulator [Desulfuromonas sp.]
MDSPDVKKNKGISKDQWLVKALELLVSNGFEAVKIERLAKLLGTSRSGFYWHFKNRQDLLQHLLDFWALEYTSVLIDDLDIKKLPADKRLLSVMKMIRDHKLAKYDLAMNAWAQVDPLVDEIVQRVVKMRLDFSREIFVELGFVGDELEMRTRLFTCYHAWEGVMFADADQDKNLRLQTLRHKMFLTPSSSAGCGVQV